MLLIGVALATPGGFALVESVATRPFRSELPAAAEYLLIALFLLSTVTAVLIAIRARRSRPLDRDSRLFKWLRAPWWVRALAMILAFAVFAGLLSLIIRADLDLPNALRGLVGDAPPEGPDAVHAPGEGGGTTLVGWLATMVFGMAVALVLSLLLVLIMPEPGSIAGLAATPDDDLDEVAGGVELGLADLTSIADPRAAVLACYLTMTSALTRAGVIHRPSDTPFELLERALLARRVDGRSARRLTELFERARFSHHRVDEGTRREALGALRAVQRELEGDR
ncbi:MAG: DUF4129 domain-containing protein [Actinomycetota bacterium]|nr:DUF4129 domain-containing protein [Actinomycetota bacterium]